MQHHLYKLVLDDALFWAPLKTEPVNVVDIGTGTGIWAIDFAERYPKSNVVGTDLSLIQPTHAAPSNCSFIREDVEDNWTQDRLFDFVHLRLMVTCFNDHDAVMKKIYDHLVPGGYVEYQAECPVSKQVSYQRATNRSLTSRYNLSVLANLLV